jgi:hypothetical protein
MGFLQRSPVFSSPEKLRHYKEVPMLRPLSLFLVTSVLSGCSVMMAASGPSHEPDLSALKAGSMREDVRRELGPPISSIRKASGDVATYQYFTGTDQSYRRAAAYAVLDGLTLGFAELVTAPAEAVQGDRHVVEVIYDTHGRVKSVHQTVHDAPIPWAKEAIDVEESSKPSSTTESRLQGSDSPS